ncbi:MAG: family protein phosphatase, partial [Myxococcales bacterium]|nr:family protein phosphatase [Myxococcales bacterium]
MTGQDWVLFSALLLVVGAVAYALGAQRRERAPASAHAAAPIPAPNPPGDAVVTIGETTSIDESELDEGGGRDEAQEPEQPKEAVKAEKAEMAAEAESSLPVIPKLYENEDDDVDITRVGSLGVPAPRTVLQAPVIRIDEDDVEQPETASDHPYFLVSATAQTDTGLRRKHNEDSLLVNHQANLFVVADGMGGHKGGELASQLAVRAMDDAFGTSTFEGKPHDEIPLEASELARAMQMANATIYETAKAKPELDGMGTTLCAARFSPTKRRLHIGHVGDSRCYRLRDGIFKQLTADHTMADLGMTGPESANLSRAVGIWAAVPIDVIVAAPSPNDVYLLCSDGLTKMLDDERIAHVLRTEEDAKAAVDRLIFFANSKGGKDNITVILVRVVDP